MAALYGAAGAPRSDAGRAALFAAMRPELGPSATLDAFLAIMDTVPALPGAGRPLQRLLVRAAVDLVPGDIARTLRLAGRGLSPWQRPLVQAAAQAADRLLLRTWPSALAARRLGLPEAWAKR